MSFASNFLIGFTCQHLQQQCISLKYPTHKLIVQYVQLGLICIVVDTTLLSLIFSFNGLNKWDSFHFFQTTLKHMKQIFSLLLMEVQKLLLTLSQMQHGDYFLHPFKLTMLSRILIIEHQGFEHFLFHTMTKLLPHVTHNNCDVFCVNLEIPVQVCSIWAKTSKV